MKVMWQWNIRSDALPAPPKPVYDQLYHKQVAFNQSPSQGVIQAEALIQREIKKQEDSSFIQQETIRNSKTENRLLNTKVLKYQIRTVQQLINNRLFVVLV
jgi:hypothetical protein